MNDKTTVYTLISAFVGDQVGCTELGDDDCPLTWDDLPSAAQEWAADQGYGWDKDENVLIYVAGEDDDIPEGFDDIYRLELSKRPERAENHLNRIAAAAREADAARHEYDRLRARLRTAIVDADTAHDRPGVNEMIRAAATGMSQQKVAECLASGRLRRQVMRVLKRDGIDAMVEVRITSGRDVDVVHYGEEEQIATVARALGTAGYPVAVKGSVVRVSSKS